MKKRLTAIIVFCVLFLLIIPVCAQDKPADTNRFVMEKLQADKKLLVAENMQLSEAEAKVFWPIYESYQKDMDKIMERTRNLIDNYAKNYETITNVKAKRLTDEMLAIENDRLKLRKSYLATFRTVLAAKKVARFYQLENKSLAVMNYRAVEVIPLVK